MAFELLDQILKESGVGVAGKEITTGTEAQIFESIDALIEDAMRTSFRGMIFESAIADDSKIQQLSIIEDAAFTEDQMLQFMDEMVTPVLALSGLAEGYSEDTIFVPSVVSNVATWIDLAESGVITKDEAKSEISEVMEAYEIPTEERSELIDIALECVAIGMDRIKTDVFELSEMVYELNSLEEETEEDWIEEGAADMVDAIREKKKYNLMKKREGVSDAGKREKINAKISAVNKAREASAGKQAKKAQYKAGKQSAKMVEKRAKFDKMIPSEQSKAVNKLQGRAQRMEKVKEVGGKVKGAVTSPTGKKVALAVGIVALLTGAALIYKKIKQGECSKVSGDAKKACMAKAADSAIANLKAAKSKCSTAKNPEKCNSSIDSQISKYENIKAKG